jgi:hypothetical protein
MNMYRVRFTLKRTGEVVDQELLVVAESMGRALDHAHSRKDHLRGTAVLKELEIMDIVVMERDVEVAL